MSLAAFKLELDSPVTCVILGLGLVGNSVAELLGQHVQKAHALTVDWNSTDDCIKKITTTINSDETNTIELVWAAGKAGFAADEDQLQAELNFYKLVITDLEQRFGKRLRVNLISSAGGIYEHSQHVTDVDATSPRRAYARAKLAQEQLLNDLNVFHRVYRISTVYGLGGKRTGLISSLLGSAISGSEVRIFA